MGLRDQIETVGRNGLELDPTADGSLIEPPHVDPMVHIALAILFSGSGQWLTSSPAPDGLL